MSTAKVEYFPNSLVHINLSNTDSGSKRINIHKVVLLSDLQLDEASNVPAPVFPSEKLAELAASPNLTPEQKSAEIKQLMDNFNTASQAYSQLGGTSIYEQILLGVQKYLTTLPAPETFTLNPQENLPYIAVEHMQLATISHPLNGEVSYLVTGLAQWG